MYISIKSQPSLYALKYQMKFISCKRVSTNALISKKLRVGCKGIYIYKGLYIFLIDL